MNSFFYKMVKEWLRDQVIKCWLWNVSGIDECMYEYHSNCKARLWELARPKYQTKGADSLFNSYSSSISKNIITLNKTCRFITVFTEAPLLDTPEPDESISIFCLSLVVHVVMLCNETVELLPLMEPLSVHRISICRTVIDGENHSNRGSILSV